MLKRSWGDGELAVFIMLNPSTADGERDDPTIRRCMSFAKEWRLDGIAVINLFQFRATDPKKLLNGHILNPPDADEEFHSAATYSDTLIAAWGSVHKRLRWRADEVRQLVKKRKPLYYLAKTSKGDPRHPLYLPKGLTPQLL